MIRRCRVAFAAIIIVAPAIFLVQSAILPGVAEARCAGVHNPITSTLEPGGVTYVSETPDTGTCNNNNTYQAFFRSHFAGWRATVWIQNNNVWSGWGGNYNTSWYYYSYGDNNSHSLIHLCLDNGSQWYCGWGRSYAPFFTHAYNGVNHGF
jgi:hypothetical protein